jgi:hypothetical protein
MATETASWFPLFEFQEYTYESFLILPSREEVDSGVTGETTTRQWAKGTLSLGQAFTSGDGYTLAGSLSFAKDVELAVSARGTLGHGSDPATFEATGTGIEGGTKGAIYQLTGWVFSEPPVNGGGRVVSIYGAVRAVRGPDARPDIELGRMPLGTTGAFVIKRTA